MAYTSGRYHLSNLLQDAYKKLGQYQAFPATGGSATTAIVGQLAGELSLKAGALFVVEDSNNSAPEGEYERITGYAKGTGTFTVDSMNSIGVGDIVAIVNDLFPLHTMVELANDAMRKLGDIVIVDTTTLDSASNKTEYALEIAAKRNLLQVDVQTNTADANDNRWYTLFDVETIPANPGVAGLMILEQLSAGRDLRYWYMDVHPRLNSYDDFIDESIHPELATIALTVAALEWQWARIRNEKIKADLNKWTTELDRALQRWPINRPPRKARMITLPRVDDTPITGRPNLVNLT